MKDHYELYKNGQLTLLEAYRQCLAEYYHIAIPFPDSETESEMEVFEKQLGKLRETIIHEYVLQNGYEYDESGCLISLKTEKIKSIANMLISEELLDRARAGISNVMEECDLPRGKNIIFTDEEIILKALELYCENLEF